MADKFRTQTRLQQLTGSVIDLKPSVVNSTAGDSAVPGGAAHQDLKDILAYYAQAISNIHGNVDFGAQTPGVIKHPEDIVLAVTGNNAGAGSNTLTVALDDYSTADDQTNIFLKFDQGSGTNGALIRLENETGTASNAIALESTVGGITLSAGVAGADALVLQANAADGGIQLDFGSSGVQFTDGTSDLLNIDSNSADFHSDVTVNVDSTTSAGSSAGALVVDGGVRAGVSLSAADGVDLLATKMVHVGTSQALKLGRHGSDSSGVQAIDTTAALIVSSSASTVDVEAGNGDLSLSAAGSSSQVIISGSQGIEFKVDENDFSYSGYSGVTGLLLAKDLEAATFQSLYSTDTTILGALNSLSNTLTSTLFEGTVSVNSSIAAETALDFSSDSNSNFTIIRVGDATSFTKAAAAKNKLDVFVNGVLQSSGSDTEMAAGTKDYFVSADSSLKFAYALQGDDIVKIIDRT